MNTHSNVWKALDRLAAEAGLSPSALARRAGLDPTTFNPSKRVSKDGRNRWPSTESIFKVLNATDRSIFDFAAFVSDEPATTHAGLSDNKQAAFEVPVMGFAQAGAGGWFDDPGFPIGQGLEMVSFPTEPNEAYLALQVQGDSMQPVYRDGDRLIVAPGVVTRNGDRVVARTTEGEVMAKVLVRQNEDGVDLASLNADHPTRSFASDEIEWLARIVWASQ